MGTMGFFAAATGLNCTDCHVDESGGNWAKYADDNDLKRTTRRMMRMVSSINTASFAGRQVVTCNTCHRGTRQPNVMPSIALLYGTPPPDEPGEPFTQAPGQPPADRILDKYLQAVGTPQRLAALHQLCRQGDLPGLRRIRKDPDGHRRQGAGSAQHGHPWPLGRQHHHARRPRRLDRGAGNREAGAAAGAHRTGAGRRQAGGGGVLSRRGSSRRSPTGASARR